MDRRTDRKTGIQIDRQQTDGLADVMDEDTNRRTERQLDIKATFRQIHRKMDEQTGRQKKSANR
jgi:hypothetical protein